MSVDPKPRHPPPFAAKIDKESDLVMIYCGARAWELAKPEGERVASLVFPRNRDPADFRWPVQGRQVLVLAQDEPDSAVEILVVELLNAGADIVHVRYSDELLVHYDSQPRRQK